MRRLPVYFLLDTSGSMYGEPIQSLNNALSGMINALRTDAQSVDTLWISIITFDHEVKEIIPLTDLSTLQLQEIVCPRSGPTFTGKALELLCEKVKKEVSKGTPTQRGDWRPLLFIYTDGKPSDSQLYEEMIRAVRDLNFGIIVGCAAGKKADVSKLKLLCDEVIHLDTTDSVTLIKYFDWVSDVIENENISKGVSTPVVLPPKPTVENNVI